MLQPSNASMLGSFDRATVDRLQSAAEKAFKATGAAEMTVAVSRSGGGTWSWASSTSGKVPTRFWWASAGKMLTAATVLRLAEEGRLSLSDPISQSEVVPVSWTGC
jgi:D-alanyl-D-alanine carboxypeptidase